MSRYFGALLRSSGLAAPSEAGPAPARSSPIAAAAAEPPNRDGAVGSMQGEPSEQPAAEAKDATRITRAAQPMAADAQTIPSSPPSAASGHRLPPAPARPIEPNARPVDRLQSLEVPPAAPEPKPAAMPQRGAAAPSTQPAAATQAAADAPSAQEAPVDHVRAALRWVAADPALLLSNEPGKQQAAASLTPALPVRPAATSGHTKPELAGPSLRRPGDLLPAPAFTQPQAVALPQAEPQARLPERPSAIDGFASPARGEAVEVSIGTIELRVDPPAPRPAAVARRAAPERAPARSHLARRALRRI